MKSLLNYANLQDRKQIPFLDMRMWDRSFILIHSCFSLQNFTFNDDFSPSSTSSADLSGLGAEPKPPGFSHSLALSSDEVCCWN